MNMCLIFVSFKWWKIVRKRVFSYNKVNVMLSFFLTKSIKMTISMTWSSVLLTILLTINYTLADTLDYIVGNTVDYTVDNTVKYIVVMYTGDPTLEIFPWPLKNSISPFKICQFEAILVVPSWNNFYTMRATYIWYEA